MRGLVLVVVGMAGCGFAAPGVSGLDASASDAPTAGADSGDGVDGSQHADAPIATVDGATGCPAGTTWATEFDSDPTVGGRFHMRDDLTIADQIANGVWSSPGHAGALDTAPLNDLDGITTARVSMQDVGNGSDNGAVLWINFGYGSDGTYGAIYISLVKTGNHQTLEVREHHGDGSEVVLESHGALPDSMIDVTLAVDSRADTYSLMVRYGMNSSGTGGQVAESPIAGNSNRYVSVLGYGSPARFDSFMVTNCPP